LNTTKLAAKVAAMTAAISAAVLTLTGCVTSEQQIATASARPRPTAVAVQAPPPAPPAVIVRAPAPTVQPVYVSVPSDIYIAGVIDRDVVFVGGNTYLWVVGPDGKRHRHFYAHGDRRAEVFRRREHLRAEMARHNAHMPHPHAEHSAYAHQPPHRPDRRDGPPVRHASAEHRPQSARIAEHREHDQGPHDHKRPPRVDEAQQQAPHRQGHAGA
jgi:hypothetical protein